MKVFLTWILMIITAIVCPIVGLAMIIVCLFKPETIEVCYLIYKWIFIVISGFILIVILIALLGR